MIEALAAILLAVVVAFYLLRPHFIHGLGRSQSSAAIAREALLDQKERCVQVLKDLDLDYATGKIGEAEFQRVRAALTAELGGLLVRLDESQPGTNSSATISA